jgi:SAM-dependent methyltransferase
MIEIGCNDGKLLDKVRKMGFVKVLGVEPSWKALEKILDSVQVYPEYFTESLATKIANEFGKFDVIVSRHVLEHIDNLHNFVRGLRIISKKDATLYIEVPDVVTFARKKDFAYWEEHLNYFSEENLIQLFAGHGFRFVKKDSFLFSGIAQLLEFSYSEQSANRINKIDGDKKTTLDHFKSQIVMAESDFRKLVDSIHSKDGRIFLWGIGSRSLGTLFSLRAINLVDFFIDENDNKIGKVVPGTGKFVAYPEFFKSEVRGNDLILLGVNYENERRVLDKLSLLGNTIHSLLSPSPIMWNHTQPACQEVG